MSTICKSPCDEAVIRAAPCTAHCVAAARRWVLVATILGSSMAFVDGSVVNVALPVLQDELDASVGQVQWIVESYALFLAALILVGGSLGDQFGRRRIFAIGVALFAAASVGCGISQTAEQLILARGVQGVGGALLVPGSLAMISATFEDDERGRAIGTWSAFTAITTAAGPVLGGLLIEQASWRWIFFINVPLATAVLLILYRRAPESRDDSAAQRLDWAGATLATVGLGGLVLGLIESTARGFDDPIVSGALAVGVVAVAAFIVVERRAAAPMMPLVLFRSRTFRGANLVTLLLYAALGGALFFLPFNLVQVQGYSITAAGAAFLPLILSIFLLSRWAGGLVPRFGPRLPLVVGPLIATAGYLLFTVPSIGGGYWTTFFPAMLVLGVGMATAVAPLTTAVMSSVETRRAGTASGINNAVSRAAGLLAIAALGIVALAVFNRNLDDRLQTIELPADAIAYLDAERTKLAAAVPPPGLGEEVRAELQSAISESFLGSFRAVMFIAAALAVASALAAWTTIEPGLLEPESMREDDMRKLSDDGGAVSEAA